MKKITDYPDLIEFVKVEEGLKLESYGDIGGVLTIGYGHTGPDVKTGEVITQTEANNLLIEDLTKALNDVYDIIPSKYYEDDGVMKSLTDFVFNLGAHNLQISLILTCLKNNDKIGASNDFSHFAYFRKNRKLTLNEGLLKRRLKEKTCFLTGKFGE